MFQNLAAMHRTTAKKFGPRIALRFRRDGLYRDLSWNEYRRQIDHAAAGLIQLGVQPGDRITILSENRYEWLMADQAILSSGAINVPLHAPLAPQQVEYQIGHSESIGAIVSNQAQADKIIEVLDSLPNLRFLICLEPIAELVKLPVLTWEGLKQRGFSCGAEGQAEVLRREAELTPESLATIIYTSGTTGNPKGVMLTHNNLGSNAEATRIISDLDASDIVLSWLPYSHIYARTVDHYLTTMVGATLCLAKSVDTLIVDLKSIKPTSMASVPRFYEKVWNGVEQLPAEECKQALWEIFQPRLRQLTSGGAPLPGHVCEGFHAADIPLLEGYGLTESSPVISFNGSSKFRIGTVGQVAPGVEVRIAEDGEILTRGPHVMAGYWNNPTATAETIIDGWLYTGDVGELDDDGFLKITDRKKDLLITSAGKNIAPSELERLLVSDIYIDQAIIYGDGRQFVSALLIPNFDNLKTLAEEQGCEIEVEKEMITTDSLRDFYAERVASIMQAVSNPERVKKSLLLSRPLDLAAEELTATLKVRRRHLIKKFESQLSALYEG